MSSFAGTMKEYVDCSIDRFDGPNLKSTAFFLSHCHEDHMVGLDNDNFAYRLQSNSQYKLYCSQVSRDLLLLNPNYCHLKKHIVVLDVSTPDGHVSHSLKIPHPTNGKVAYEVKVTLLQAGHCPGSVMFLFDGPEGRVLYTGDFRLRKVDLSAMEALHTGSKPKDLKSLYIDTTFLTPSAAFIPTREESAEASISIAGQWLRQSDNHHVMLSHAARLGYEQLYKEMSLALNMKVHVDERKYKEYAKMGDMVKYCTNNPHETRLHACRCRRPAKLQSETSLACGSRSSNGDPIQLRTIKLSTMAFVQSVGMDDIKKRKSETFYRVCYSFHSSYSEIRDMVMYLKPGRAFPNVVPMNEHKNEIINRLNKIVEHGCQVQEPSLSQQSCKLGKLVRRRKRKQINNTPDSDLDFGDSQTPKKSKSSQSQDTSSTTQQEKDAQSSKGKSFRFTGFESSDDDMCEEEQIDIDLTHTSTDTESTLSEVEDNSQDMYQELSSEDRASLDKFTPIQGGSLGQYVSYCSDSEDDCEVLSNENKMHLKQTVEEKSSKSIISKVHCSGTIEISDESQPLNLYLDGASDDAETKTETSQGEGSGDAKKEKGDKDGEVNKQGNDVKVDKVENGDVDGAGEGKKVEGSCEKGDGETEGEKSKDNDETKSDEKDDEKQNENDNDVNEKKAGEEGEDKLLEEDSNDIEMLYNQALGGDKAETSKVADDSSMIELFSDEKSRESTTVITLDGQTPEKETLESQSSIEFLQSTSKRKRVDSDSIQVCEAESSTSGGQPPSKKGPSTSKGKAVAKSAKAKEVKDDESDEDVILVDSDENSRDNVPSVDYNYLTKQQYMVQCILALQHKQRAMKAKAVSGGPIDLTGEEEEESDNSEVEALDSSELDTEEEAELHDYDSDSSQSAVSIDDAEWDVAYKQFQKLRRSGKPKEAPPSEGVIVLDSSDEEEEVEKEKDGKGKTGPSENDGKKDASSTKEDKKKEKEAEKHSIDDQKPETSGLQKGDKDTSEINEKLESDHKAQESGEKIQSDKIQSDNDVVEEKEGEDDEVKEKEDLNDEKKDEKDDKQEEVLENPDKNDKMDEKMDDDRQEDKITDDNGQEEMKEDNEKDDTVNDNGQEEKMDDEAQDDKMDDNLVEQNGLEKKSLIVDKSDSVKVVNKVGESVEEADEMSEVL